MQTGMTEQGTEGSGPVARSQRPRQAQLIQWQSQCRILSEGPTTLVSDPRTEGTIRALQTMGRLYLWVKKVDHFGIELGSTTARINFGDVVLKWALLSCSDHQELHNRVDQALMRAATSGNGNTGGFHHRMSAEAPNKDPST